MCIVWIALQLALLLVAPNLSAASAQEPINEVAQKAGTLKQKVNAAFCTGSHRHEYWHHRPCTKEARGALDDVVQALSTAAGNNSVPCSADGTLRTLPPGRFMVTLNLNNNQDLLPHLMIQLIHLLGNVDHGTHIFVSVFESGSRDATVQWLIVLKDVLVALRVPHRILAGV
jgi:hypothetical protein